MSVTPLESALTDTPSRKSFRISSYKNTGGGWGALQPFRAVKNLETKVGALRGRFVTSVPYLAISLLRYFSSILYIVIPLSNLG